MLKRKAEARFQSWYEGPRNKALLVMGARQVGKSYLAERFARDHFSHVVVFDLLRDASARESFAGATSADDLLLRMSVAATEPLVPGKTVVIFDEVQECPGIVTFIKYLVQQGDYRYILTGSLLGVKLQNIDSLPVGFASRLDMYPLDFEEFCWAMGLDEQVMRRAVACALHEERLPDYLYNKLSDLFHRYLMVGGMPDAVNAFVSTNNIDEVRTVHLDLHALYRDDITKHAPDGLRLVIRDIYDLIPSQVINASRRFQFGSIENVKRFSQVQDHFLWLTNAGVSLAVYNVAAPVKPLLMNEQHNKFKLFYLDAGMLASTYPKAVYEGLLDGRPTANMGAVYEAFVAQELAAHGFALRYYASRKVGELDFLAERADGELMAIEVKSGASYLRHASLDHALASPGFTIDRAIVFAETNVRKDDRVLYLPAFLVGMFTYRD